MSFCALSRFNRALNPATSVANNATDRGGIRVSYANLDGDNLAPYVVEQFRQMAPLVAFEQPVPSAARGNIAVQNLVIKGTLPPRVREIFSIRWSERHAAAFRAVTASHRRARHLFPRRMRRGRNDVFFDSVTRSERRRGGTRTPDLVA